MGKIIPDISYDQPACAATKSVNLGLNNIPGR